MILEEAIRPDFGLVQASVVDHAGNCYFNAASQNFNPVVAMASRNTIVATKSLVETGQIAPGHVHLPGIFIQRIVALR